MFNYKTTEEFTLPESGVTAKFYKNLPVYLFKLLASKLNEKSTLLDSTMIYTIVCVLSWSGEGVEDASAWLSLAKCKDQESVDEILAERTKLISQLPAKDIMSLADILAKTVSLSDDEKKNTPSGPEVSGEEKSEM